MASLTGGGLTGSGGGGASGGLVFISSTDLTSAKPIIALSGGYSLYKVVVVDVDPGAGAKSVALRFGIDGSTIRTGANSYNYEVAGTTSGGTVVTAGSTSSSCMALTGTLAFGGHIEFYIYGAASGSIYTGISGTCISFTAASPTTGRSCTIGGSYDAAAEIHTHMQLGTTAALVGTADEVFGNLVKGTALLYGIATS
jgi:hypothetical protein